MKIREYLLLEINFKSKEAFLEYSKKHKVRPSTKVTIAGVEHTAGEVSKGEPTGQEKTSTPLAREPKPKVSKKDADSEREKIKQMKTGSSSKEEHPHDNVNLVNKKLGLKDGKWEKERGYADKKLKDTDKKLKELGFKVKNSQSAGMNYTRDLSTYTDKHGNKVEVRAAYGPTSGHNSFSIKVIPAEIKEKPTKEKDPFPQKKKMKGMSKEAFLKATKEGKFEAETDISKAGFVEIRRPNGKRETIEIY